VPGPLRCRSSHSTGRHERLTLRHWTQSSPGATLRPMSLTVRDLDAAARRRIREIQPAELLELQKFGCPVVDVPGPAGAARAVSVILAP
jgi:hypothetical protein